MSTLQGFALVSPLEGFSHCAIEITNEFKDVGQHVLLVNWHVRATYAITKMLKPNLYLIEPEQCFGAK